MPKPCLVIRRGLIKVSNMKLPLSPDENDPNLWIIDFGFTHGPTDQGIHMAADVKNQKVIKVELDEE